MRIRFFFALIAALALSTAPALGFSFRDTSAAREGAGVAVTWPAAAGPVDILVSDQADAPESKMRTLAKADADGRYVLANAPSARPYFLLRAERTGQTYRVAERLLPLTGASNFRDVGGYPAADGKHVRWGRIFRSGGMPNMTKADYAYLSRLGIRTIVDLRSSEERELFPTRWGAHPGAQYIAVDYSGAEVFAPVIGAKPAVPDRYSYAGLPTALAPQFKAIFQHLLNDKGGVVYNCSAGQDRTGVATALVLSALGVPREVIYADYHLSTLYRRPQNEMTPIDPARYPNNALAAYFAKRAQASAATISPRPLYDAQGLSLLSQAFASVEAQYGSVDNYLDRVLGVDQKAISRLRADYLE